jgi:hypothetical protein
MHAPLSQTHEKRRSLIAAHSTTSALQFDFTVGMHASAERAKQQFIGTQSSFFEHTGGAAGGGAAEAGAGSSVGGGAFDVQASERSAALVTALRIVAPIIRCNASGTAEGPKPHVMRPGGRLCAATPNARLEERRATSQSPRALGRSGTYVSYDGGAMLFARAAMPSFSDAPTLRRLLSAPESEPAIELDENDFEIVEPGSRWRLLSSRLAAAFVAAGIAIGFAFDPAARAAIANAARWTDGGVFAVAPVEELSPSASTRLHEPGVVTWPRDSTKWVSWQPSPANVDWAARATTTPRALRAPQASAVVRHPPRHEARAATAAQPPTRAGASPVPKIPRDDNEAATKAAREAKKALQNALR